MRPLPLDARSLSLVIAEKSTVNDARSGATVAPPVVVGAPATVVLDELGFDELPQAAAAKAIPIATAIVAERFRKTDICVLPCTGRARGFTRECRARCRSRYGNTHER